MVQCDNAPHMRVRTVGGVVRVLNETALVLYGRIVHTERRSLTASQYFRLLRLGLATDTPMSFTQPRVYMRPAVFASRAANRFLLNNPRNFRNIKLYKFWSHTIQVIHSAAYKASVKCVS